MKISVETKRALKNAMSLKGKPPVYCRGLMIFEPGSSEGTFVAVTLDNPVAGSVDPVGDAIQFEANALKGALSGKEREMQFHASANEVFFNGIRVGAILDGESKAAAELLVEHFYQRMAVPLMGQIRVNTEALKKVSPFAAKNDIRERLNAVALEPATHTMVGTNGHMMLIANTSSCTSVHADGWDVIQEKSSCVEKPRQVLLRANVIAALLAAAETSFTVDVPFALPTSDSEECGPHGDLRIHIGGTYFLVPPIDDVFVDWRRTVPQQFRTAYEDWAFAEVDLSAIDWSKIRKQMNVKPSQSPMCNGVKLLRKGESLQVCWESRGEVLDAVPVIRDISTKRFTETGVNALYAETIVKAIGDGADWTVACYQNTWVSGRHWEHTIVARNGPYTALLMPTRV